MERSHDGPAALAAGFQTEAVRLMVADQDVYFNPGVFAEKVSARLVAVDSPVAPMQPILDAAERLRVTVALYVPASDMEVLTRYGFVSPVAARAGLAEEYRGEADMRVCAIVPDGLNRTNEYVYAASAHLRAMGTERLGRCHTAAQTVCHSLGLKVCNNLTGDACQAAKVYRAVSSQPVLYAAFMGSLMILGPGRGKRAKRLRGMYDPLHEANERMRRRGNEKVAA